MSRLTVIGSSEDEELQVCGMFGGSATDGLGALAGVVENGVASTVVLERSQPFDL